MNKKYFTVILKYIASTEEMDLHRPEHWKFLDKYYQKGNLIMSGPQNPKNGGVIIATAPDKALLEEILKEDPFSIHDLAEYTIYEFIPTKYISELANIIINK